MDDQLILERWVPAGMKFLIKAKGGKDLSLRCYQVSVLVITFLAYTSYHASRKPISIVKSVLDPEIPSVHPNSPAANNNNVNVDGIHLFLHFHHHHHHSIKTSPPNSQSSSSSPFRKLLGLAAHSRGTIISHMQTKFSDPLNSGGCSRILRELSGDLRNSRLSSTFTPEQSLNDLNFVGIRALSDEDRGRYHLTALLMHNDTSSSFVDDPQGGWPPFNGELGKSRLGEIDLAFLSSYAIAMYFAGHLGDRLDLRVFLTLGMVFSGVFVCLFGCGYWLKIHSFSYYAIVQIVGGVFQATGWPSVVAIVANWFEKDKRGLIMGVWNSHTSVGNIFGSLLAGAVLQYGWGWSFVLPGLMIVSAAFIVFLFLVVEPSRLRAHEDGSAADLPRVIREAKTGLGIEMAERSFKSDLSGESISLKSARDREKKTSGVTEIGDLLNGEEESVLLMDHDGDVQQGKIGAVGFWEAWTTPGVYQFAISLFFSKLVAYTFLYWLPFYIRHNKIGSEYLSDKAAGNLSTVFDIGGVVGGTLAGIISDKLNARALTTSAFIYCSIPALIVYRVYGCLSLRTNIGLLVILGIVVNGPYSLITTAVSADLGTHSSLKRNSRALATVTAIIDGTGSVGAAVGPLLTGYISQKGWTAVFVMLMFAASISGLSLSGLVYDEITRKFISGSVSKVAEGPIVS